MYEGVTAVTSYCWGSITAAGVGEEAAERLPLEENEESQQRGEGSPVRRAAPPAGGTLNPLEQMKQGANIFQAFG